MDCGRFRDDLATLAEGGSRPEAERHVAACPSCAERLAVERRIVAAARLREFEPPASLLEQAYAFMPPRPRLVARLLGNGLAASGMRRSGTERFSLAFGVGDHEVPLQYVPVKGGWEVAGRAPSPEWSVVRDGESLPCDDAGRFRLTVASLEDSAFTLRGPNAEIDVPAASGLLDREP